MARSQPRRGVSDADEIPGSSTRGRGDSSPNAGKFSRVRRKKVSQASTARSRGSRRQAGSFGRSPRNGTGKAGGAGLEPRASARHCRGRATGPPAGAQHSRALGGRSSLLASPMPGDIEKPEGRSYGEQPDQQPGREGNLKVDQRTRVLSLTPCLGPADF